jgi:dCMP deaminase
MRLRPEREVWLMGIAEMVALRSTCSRLNVGALAVRGGQVLAWGYNGAPAGMPHCEHETSEPCTRAVHAEVNVIASAARYGISLHTSDLYVTHSPCLSCAGLLINAGIGSITYLHEFRDLAGLELLRQANVAVTSYWKEHA